MSIIPYIVESNGSSKIKGLENTVCRSYRESVGIKARWIDKYPIFGFVSSGNSHLGNECIFFEFLLNNLCVFAELESIVFSRKRKRPDRRIVE